MAELRLEPRALTTVGSIRRRRQLLVALLALAIAVDVGVAALVQWRLTSAVQAQVAAVVSAEVDNGRALYEEWFKVRESRLTAMLQSKTFRDHALAVLAAPNDPTALDQMRGEAERITVAGVPVPWAIATLEGRLVLDEARLGATVPAGVLEALATREALLLPPRELAPGDRRGVGIAPVLRDGERVGFLIVTLEADAFARGPFAMRWLMETGELYAFDDQGTMLSQSRFPEALRTAGLLGPDTESSAGQLSLRDPGVQLADGSRPGALRSTLPFTHPVTEALAGRAGVDVKGYRDYRGEQVVGAWWWDPVRRIGLVAEIDQAEATTALRLVRPLLLGLVIALGLVIVGGVFLYSRSRAAEARAERLEKEANRLGQYELVRKLGEGGMGVVFEGRHALLQRPAAIKVMRAGTLNDEQVARFDREARATASLAHPNTISIFDFGRSADGSFYYVMELLRGADLDQLVERTGPLPDARVVHVLKAVCGSLAEAHLLGLVHRDLKPSNVFLTSRPGVHDVVKVLDFGLVRTTRGIEAGMTQSQLIMGTPLYMAPELFDGADRATPSSDLYAIGAIAFWLLTGKHVFDPNLSFSDLMLAHRTRAVRPVAEVRGAPCDEALQSFIDACLQKDQAQRPHSVAAALRVLETSRAGPWTDAQAREWWEQQGARLAAHDAPPALATPSGTDDTIRRGG